jgi:group I intron endonuclease
MVAKSGGDAMGLIDWLFGKNTRMGVYAIVNKVDGKLYVGSSKDLRRRWRNHLRELQSSKHSNDHLQRAFSKYGEDAFEFRILQDVASEEELIPAEQYWLDFTRCYDRRYGYNIDPAADRSVISFETAAKISARIRGRVRSEETRAKMRAASVGRTFSEETRAKLSAANSGKTLPAETRTKISEALKGRIFTEDHRAKIGQAWQGRAHTEETLRKMTGVNSPLTPEQVREIRRRSAAGESSQSLAEAYGVHRATIWNIIKRKTWSLLPDEE